MAYPVILMTNPVIFSTNPVIVSTNQPLLKYRAYQDFFNQRLDWKEWENLKFGNINLQTDVFEHEYD